MSNAVRHIRSVHVVTLLLLAGGLIAGGLLGVMACTGPPELPDRVQDGPVPQPVPAFAAFLSADRSVLIRGDVNAGRAALGVTTNRDATFVWALTPDDLLNVSDNTPLTVTEPSSSATLNITGVIGDPTADGKTVQVEVAATEWLCDDCLDEAGAPLAAVGGQIPQCIDNEPVAGIAECSGESITRTLALQVRRPEAPLMVSLAAVEGTSMQPVTEKRIKAVVSAGKPFGQAGGDCTVRSGSIEPADDTNGKPYCVTWRVVENLSPAPQVALDERLAALRLRSGSVALDEDPAETIAEVVYDAPAASGNVTFQVTVVDAAGPAIQREVTVDVLSQGTGAVSLTAASDHPDLCTGEHATITAAATGGTGENTYGFELVGAALPGETLTSNGATATYEAPTSAAVTRTIRVSVTEPGGSSDQTNVVIKTIARSFCDDGNICTADVCTYGACGHAAASGPCDDGNACTSGDTCANGVCTGTTLTCDDGNPCTSDFCESSGGCQYIANTNPCDDGDACTSGDVCSGGACSGGPLINCNDGNPCTDDSCDPGSGCINAADDTNTCDDGFFCTDTDVCDNGNCVGSGDPCVAPELCSEALDTCVECLVNADCDDTNVCTDDDCSLGSCVYTDNASSCDDGLYCNGTDTCAGGGCSAHAGNPCVAPDVCDEATDTCVACLTGADCDDGEVCTSDTCAGGVCLYVPNLLPCDDGLFCNGADTCDLGTCSVHAGDPCVAPDSCDEAADACVECSNHADCDDTEVCTKDRCVAGSCVYTNQGGACDDGLFCNGADSCLGGACSGHAGDPCGGQICDELGDVCVDCFVDPDCDDGDVCTDDACVGGTCEWTVNTAPCDDGLFCNGTDECAAGSCSVHAGDPCAAPDICSEADDACVECLTAADCNDSEICTTDACAGGTCLNVPNALACDDGLFCNGADICSLGTCSVHAGNPCVPPELCDEAADACVECLVAADCDDGIGCTDDTCDGGTHTCSFVPDDANCDNGLYCDGVETCDAALDCQPGVAVDCDDTLTCTADTCDEGADACDNALDPASCLILDVCYGDLDLNPANECQQCDVAADQLDWTNVPDGTSCTTCPLGPPDCECQAGVCENL
jgi:hypothetical protein